MGSIKNI